MTERVSKGHGVQCDILVRGNVKTGWLEQLSDLTLSGFDTEAGHISRLSGHVADQAAMLGILNGLDGLGLSLISVSCSAQTR